MKRVLALICVLVCLSVLCLPVMAAEDTITVYVDAPSDWTQVNLYVWTRDKNGADTPLTDWPGTAMTEVEDGWYALEIPAGNNYVIANNGANQTVDLEMDGTIDTWLTVTAAGSDGKHGGDIMYVNPGPALDDVPSAPSDEEPVELKSLALVGEGIPGLQSWIVEDPAGDMELVSDGVYSKEIAVTAGTSMQFKVAGNDTWDSPYNFGGSEDPTAVTLGTSAALVSGNESKNLSLTVEKDCTLKFTVTITDGSAALLVQEVAGTVVEPQPTEPEATEPEATEPATEATQPQATQPTTNTSEEKPTPSTTPLIVIVVVVIGAIALATVISLVPSKFS